MAAWVMNGLKFAYGFAERAPLLGIMRGGFERALRQAHGLSGDSHAPAIQRFERDLQPLPFFTQAIFLRHFAIGKNNFRRTRRAQAHFIFVAAHAKAGEAGLDQKSRDGFSRGSSSAGGSIGLGKDQIEAAFAAIGDPTFRAVEAIALAVARRVRLDGGGIRAGLRLGETKGA